MTTTAALRQHPAPSLFLETARNAAWALPAAACGWLAYRGIPSEIPLIGPVEAPLSAAAQAWVGFVGMLYTFAAVQETGSRSRASLVFLFAGWSLGAASVVPSIWSGFFYTGPLSGSAALVIWSLLMATPALLVPMRILGLALPIWMVFAALVPPWALLGFGSLMLAGSAGLPGLGPAAFALPVVLACAPWASERLRLRGHRLKVSRLPWLVLLVSCLAGTLAASAPAKKLDERTWARQTAFGLSPTDLTQHYDRQDTLKSEANKALDAGVSVVLFPESSNRKWSEGEAAYWSSVIVSAQKKKASVILGVSTEGAMGAEPVNALVDMQDPAALHHAMMPMPIGLWHPWRRDNHIPMRWDVEPIRTSLGDAIYTLCYEDLLVWPALLRWSVADHPVLMLSAANQWFADDEAQVPQTRSASLLARALGTPLLRAVAHQ